MSGGSSGGKGVWVAITLIVALVIATIAAGAIWAATSGRPAGDRFVGALGAGGAVFIAVATLGILTVGTVLSE